MDWHLTWQDPVALGLALAGVAFAWWLRRKTASKVGGGCSTCETNPLASASGSEDEPSTRSVPTSQLRIGQR